MAKVLQSAWAKSLHPAWTRDDVLRLTKLQLARTLDSVRKYKPRAAAATPHSATAAPRSAARPPFSGGPAAAAAACSGAVAVPSGPPWMFGVHEPFMAGEADPATATARATGPGGVARRRAAGQRD